MPGHDFRVEMYKGWFLVRCYRGTKFLGSTIFPKGFNESDLRRAAQAWDNTPSKQLKLALAG